MTPCTRTSIGAGCILLRAGDVHGEPGAGDGASVLGASDDSLGADASDAEEGSEGELLMKIRTMGSGSLSSASTHE